MGSSLNVSNFPPRGLEAESLLVGLDMIDMIQRPSPQERLVAAPGRRSGVNDCGCLVEDARFLPLKGIQGEMARFRRSARLESFGSRERVPGWILSPIHICLQHDN